MSQTSTIEWTDATWNPVRGCTKISPGCKHCYAETFAERFRGVPGHPYEQGFDLRIVPDKLAEPLRWGTAKTIFVNSMSDLFHKDVPKAYLRQVVEVMRVGNWHTYQVLTKRADSQAKFLHEHADVVGTMKHVWWGVSVEDRKFGLPRVDYLRETPGAIKFLSVEPLLEDLGEINLAGIDWVIVGGESGVGARPMEEQWVRNILLQCKASKVPFFFKQWGGLHKSKTGRLLNGVTYDEMPQRVKYDIPSREARARLLSPFDLAQASKPIFI
jgi:protein gp37